MSNEVKVTTGNFETEVLKSPVPVLVDFWAEWCMPCRMIAPSLEQMSQSYAGRLKIGKVNVDEEGDLAMRYNIISIPTLILFKDGQAVKNHVGAAPRQALDEMVKGFI